MIGFATCSLLIAAVMIGFVSAQPTTLSIADGLVQWSASATD